MLVEHLNVPHISTGALLRRAIEEGSELGTKAKAIIEKGELVPDDVMLGIVEQRLGAEDAAAGFILDGYPRTLGQAEALQCFSSLDMVVCLEADNEELKRRILARGQGRIDDTEEVIEERLRVYDAQTAPLIEYYDGKSLLRRVDGIGSIDEIFARIKATVESPA